MAAIVETTEVEGIWKVFQSSRSLEVRNELVLRYAWLVKSIVRRISSVSNNYADADDLTSYGMIGLIKAVEKFDPEKGVTFETFATYRIRGEIIDYLRRNDWVPRSVRKKIMQVENASNELTAELGRQPTDEELSGRLGIGSGELRQAYSDMEKYSLISFEELMYDSVRIESDYPDFDTPEGHLQENELLEVLAQAINSLPDRERLILTLYYYEELTLKEISSIIGVSESRVSQIHTRSIEKLKENLRHYISQ